MKSCHWRNAVLIAALAWSIPASAQESGLYLGGSVGAASHRDACDNLDQFSVASGIPCDDSDTAWRLFAGYQFRHVAIELGYSDLGRTRSSGSIQTNSFRSADATMDFTAWDLVAIGSISLTDGLSFYGKVGMYWAETALRSSSVLSIPFFIPPVSRSSTASGEEKNSGLTFGAGASVAIRRHFGVRLEWQHYEKVGGPSTGESDIELFSLGLLFRF
jgi:OmpA-OmpF porin, OOP family